MKTLLVSFLFVVFAQSANANQYVTLNESHSKKLYDILAAFGLSQPLSGNKITYEHAKPANCAFLANQFVCNVHDQLHNSDVIKRGTLAKYLYYYLMQVNGSNCSGPNCFTRSPQILCLYRWSNQANPAQRHFLCVIEKNPR